MSPVSAVIYFFSMLAGFTAIVYAVNLFKIYHRKYVSQYLFFLIAYFISGFLNLIARNLVNEFCSQNLFLRTMTDYSMVLLGFPFFVLTLFFFISFTRKVAEQAISQLFMVWYFMVWLAVLVALLWGIKIYISTGDNHFISVLLSVINYLILTGLLLSLFKLWFQSRWIFNKSKQRGLRFLAILYMGLFSGLFVLSRLIPDHQDSGRYAIVVIIYFVLNFPPLLYLKKFLARYFTSKTLQEEEKLYLASFFGHYHISNQEGVVINLILEGRDNLSIAKKLSISEGTIKNHIYKIYKKVGINSRVKLIQQVRDHLSDYQSGKKEFL
jgi:DNA-binding CsgD family transcriptional regulator